jgi:hypothetical protein
MAVQPKSSAQKLLSTVGIDWLDYTRSVEHRNNFCAMASGEFHACLRELLIGTDTEAVMIYGAL